MRRFALGTVAMITLVSGCATTEQVAVKEQPAVCAFLGADVCARLTPGGEGQAGLRWVNPSAQPTQYSKVIADVIGFYGSDAEKIPPKDQQTLTDLFRATLTESLATRYQVVEQPGPGVLRVQVAILDAEAATPGMRSITMVVPQMRLLSTGASYATGKFPFAGGAQAAFKVTDAVTGRILGAAVDRRVGGGSIETAAQWQWGDAENAIKAWSKLVVERLYAYTSGAVKP